MYGPGFSVVEISFKVFFIAAHVVPASANASVKSGSRPLGNAPACRETTNVSGPADTDPVDVVAQPASTANEAPSKSIFIIALGTL
jgi:hypothetical protein